MSNNIYLLVQAFGLAEKVIGAYSDQFTCQKQADYLNGLSRGYYHKCQTVELNYIYN